MNLSPQFSVVMASYQRAHLIERAVQSLTAQTFRDWELLVADDGSTDNTRAVLARLARTEPRLRAWRHSNLGQARARNRLLQHARGRWITFLDSDDSLRSDHLALRAEAIAQQPELQLILAPMQVIGEPWVDCLHGSGQQMHVDECLAVGMLCVRADRLRATDGFPKMDYGEDSTLIDRLKTECVHQLWIHDRSYRYHRDHGSGLTALRRA